MLNLKKYNHKIKTICSELNLKKLDIFGSAITDNFNLNSDIDIIVEFNDNENENLFDKYFELKFKLENLFKRKVDIVIEKSLKNPFFKQSLEQTRRNLYVA